MVLTPLKEPYSHIFLAHASPFIPCLQVSANIIIQKLNGVAEEEKKSREKIRKMRWKVVFGRDVLKYISISIYISFPIDVEKHL